MNLRDVLEKERLRLDETGRSRRQKAAEKEIQRAKSYFHDLFGLQPDSMVVVDDGVQLQSGDLELLFVDRDSGRCLSAIHGLYGLFFVFPCAECGERVWVWAGISKSSAAIAFTTRAVCDECRPVAQSPNPNERLIESLVELIADVCGDVIRDQR